jgi:23S rRNA (cytosine1962-C5)-methyltransferase
LALPIVKISRHGAARLRSGHPWVYRSDLRLNEKPGSGALVTVTAENGRPFGSALFSSASEIALRLLTPKPLPDEAAMLAVLRNRVKAAIEYRRKVVANSNAYRVIFSEADGIPGFIADRYNSIVSVQVLTQAMDRPDVKQVLISALLEELAADGVTSVIERVEPRIRQLEQLPESKGGFLAGNESSCVYQMNGINFTYEAGSGQKTGSFLDQRENYAAAERHAHGEALDVFCYQGGFAVHLARKCSSVTALDSSRPALEVAEQNEQLNPGRTAIGWIEGNAFDFLKDYSAQGREYDTIVLDPPAFARGKQNLETAMRGYKELNLRALKMLRRGGILVTCSCSFHVSDQDFLAVLTAAAADVHRNVVLLEHRTQSSDHPILLTVPETHYLKCLIVMVV